MVIRSRILYEEVAKKHNLPIELIESVGNCVFEQLRIKLDAPSELAYELPKLGTFIARFKPFEKTMENIMKAVNSENPLLLQRIEEDPKRYNRNISLYKKMQEYREAKKKFKNETAETSKDNVSQHKEVPAGMEEISNIQVIPEEKDTK
jgi:hypothetical protein